MVRTAVISTGRELLHGAVQDTNARFISSLLFPTDFRVMLFLSVADDPDHIEYALRQAMERSDLVIITGGLGPTEDDYTLQVLQSLIGFQTTIHEEGRQRMESFFGSLKMVPLEGDLKMVTVPSGADLFLNEVGLATGFTLRSGGIRFVVMPGVPREMEPMFANKVLPFLSREYNLKPREHTVFRTILLREAEVNNRIKGMDIPFAKLEWGISARMGMNVITFVESGAGGFPSQRIREEMERIFGDALIDGEDRKSVV